MKPYNLQFFHRLKIDDGTIVSKDIYRFKTRFNRVYFIELERYENSLYIAKFYLRIHKDLKDKYKIVINDGDGLRVLSTCISLALKVNAQDPLASFGFIGERRLEESMNNTQRYRIYSMMSAKYFSPKKYDHVKDDNTSLYFILNKQNCALNKDIIEARINEYYVFE